MRLSVKLYMFVIYSNSILTLIVLNLILNLFLFFPIFFNYYAIIDLLEISYWMATQADFAEML